MISQQTDHSQLLSNMLKPFFWDIYCLVWLLITFDEVHSVVACIAVVFGVTINTIKFFFFLSDRKKIKEMDEKAWKYKNPSAHYPKNKRK